MSKLLERLRDARRSGVYRAARPDDIEEVARGSGLDLARVSLAQVRDRDALMNRLAGSLGFPSWFGANWDALEDCLGDLSWRPGEGHVIVVEAAESLGSDDRGVLIDVLRSSAEYWAGRGKPFFAVFIDRGDALALPPLYRQR